MVTSTATPHPLLQYYATALPRRWVEDAQDACALAQCRAGSPSSPIASPQGGAQLCMEPEICSSLEAGLTYGSKHSTFPLLFGETKLGDDKCARWTSFACRNLISSSLCWSYKQWKDTYIYIYIWTEQSQTIYTHTPRPINFLLISTSSAVIPLSPPFLQHKSLCQLPFNCHWDRYLNNFSAQGWALQENQSRR